MKAHGEEPDGDMLQASETVKRHASGNRVELEISADAFEALMQGWRKANPNRPAEISFVVEGREVGNFKVAACAYTGDTCCA
jgi:hypothetical protein